MISFLNPLFWLGLVALGAPIWLHLRRRVETNILPFSAVRFLEDQPFPKQSPWRLRNVLLLLLRVLGLLLIVGAFAWPYRARDAGLVIRESRVYILDNTLSQQANDNLARQQAEILAQFDEAGADIQVAVISLESQPRVVVGFADDRASARARIVALKPTHQRGAYLPAFRQAKSLLDNSLGPRKRILYYGDSQENQWRENVQAPPFLQDIEVTIAPVTATNAPNLSLAEPHLQRIFLGDKSLVNFAAKLTHQSPAVEATLILRANGRVIFNRTMEFKDQPETILLSAQWESDPGVWLQGDLTVEGTPDSLGADNHLYFSLPPVREGQVAVLANSEYLRLALSPEVMRGQWHARTISPQTLPDEVAADRDAEVLVIESVYLQSTEARKLVWRYLTNRRGVLLLVNRLTPTITGALRELGFETQSANSAQGHSDPFQYVFFHHPIFHPFLSPDYGSLLEVQVLRHERLKAIDGMPLIFGRSGDGLFFQGTRFPGKLYVAAFGLERGQTMWPLHQTFIPFLDLCLQNSRPEDVTPLAYEPDDASIITLAGASQAQEVVLRRNGEELMRRQVTDGKAQLRLPDEPGLYEVAYDPELEPQKILSVNTPVRESDLHYTSTPEALRVWRIERVEGAKPARAIEEGAVSLTLGSIWRQRYWWWLVVGALGLLLLEVPWTGLRKGKA